MSNISNSKLSHLTTQSTNDEIMKAAFGMISDLGYMIFSTVDQNGNPASRALEIHYLDDSGVFYVGMAHGKPVYYEIKRNPLISCVVVGITEDRLSESVRLTTKLVEIDPEEKPNIYQRYWELNRGTAALYHKDLDRFKIFKMESGFGRIFQNRGPAVVENLRFTWGGATLPPWAYEIDEEKCAGCGLCESLCMEDVIHPTPDGKYRIDHINCLECGRCADHCPNDAVICNGRG